MTNLIFAIGNQNDIYSTINVSNQFMTCFNLNPYFIIYLQLII